MALNSASRVPELDGIRGLAILLVLYRHYVDVFAFSSTHWGHLLVLPGRLSWAGVDLFFVLSGFLIGGILLDARNSQNYFGTFYVRRALRIFPIYALTLAAFAVCCLLRPAMEWGEARWLFESPMPWFSYATYTQNFWMASRGVFGAAAVGITWSLAIEEQFYLTLPLAIRLLAPKLLQLSLSVAVLAVPMLRVMIFHRYGGLADYVLLPCRADALLLGVFCATIVRLESLWSLVQHRKWILWVFFAVMTAGLPLLALSVERDGAYSFRMISVGYTWIALFCTSLLLLAVSDTAVSWALRNRVIRWFGSIAYGVYLVHLAILGLCLALIRRHGWYVHDWGDVACVTLAAAITVSLCSASWLYLEKPLVVLGHQWKY